MKLPKNELVKIAIDYQGKFSSPFQSVKDDIRESKSKLNILESELSSRKNVTDNFAKYVKTLERKCHESKQYSRRKCLEI